MRFHQFLCVLAALAFVGCGGSSTQDAAPTGDADASSPGISAISQQAATPTDQAGPASQAGDEDAATPDEIVLRGPDGQPADEAAMEEPGSSGAPAPGTERVKAEKGVGLKGRSLDEHQGLIVTPARAYFSARERMVFEAAVPTALKLYEATNGNAPRSHEEFMTQVIQASSIQLPQLPPGQRYVYDPETKELMVERPRRQP